MKTEALKQALDLHGFDAAIGGARRDEEPSRAKERIFSLRSRGHRWDPRGQRPELWHLYNGRLNPGESIRVFPLSNWTELDIWTYIERENIPVVPLYFAAGRMVVERNGMLILRDDERLTLLPKERPELRWVRFRTLGCYPLTGAIDSRADTVAAIIDELARSRTSERQGRAIDHGEGLDGAQEDRRLLLMDAGPDGSLLRFITCGSVDDGKSTLIGRLLVDADVVPGRSSRGRSPISQGWSTASRRNASRASPSTSATAISRRRGGASSLPTRRATSSTRATWRRAPRPPTSRSSWSTRPRACCRRPSGTAPSWR